MSAQIVEEWSPAFIDATFQLCLCSAVTYEHEHSYGCTDGPQNNCSPACFLYSFQIFELIVLSRLVRSDNEGISGISQWA